LKPTLFPSVPRLLNRVYDKINAAIEVQGGLTSMVKNNYLFIYLFILALFYHLKFNLSLIIITH